MRFYLLSLVVVLLSACSGGDGGTGPEPGPLRASFVKLGGDGQHAKVKGFSGNRQPLHVIRMAVAAVDDSLFPLPLIGRLVITGGAAMRSNVPGVHFNTLPANLVVQWNASDPSCAHAYLTTTLPAPDSTVTNRAVRGTKSGTCMLRAVTLNGAEPMAVDSFTFTVDPGPPAASYDVSSNATTFADSVEIPANALQDAYGNAIPFTIEAPDDSVPLTASGHVVRFAGTRNASGVWLGNGGSSATWLVYLLDSAGARSGKMHIRVAAAAPQMDWRATGLGVP